MKRLSFVLWTEHGSMGRRKPRKDTSPENFTIFYDSFNPILKKKVQIIDMPDRYDMFGEMTECIVEDWAKIELSKRDDYVFGLCNLNDSLVFPNKLVKESLIQYIKSELNKKFDATYISNYDKQRHMYYFDLTFDYLEDSCEILSFASKEYQEEKEIDKSKFILPTKIDKFRFKFVIRQAPAFNVLMADVDENTHAIIRYNNLCYSFGSSPYDSHLITNYDTCQYGLGFANPILRDWFVSQESKQKPYILGLSHGILELNLDRLRFLEETIDTVLSDAFDIKNIESRYDGEETRACLFTVEGKPGISSYIATSFSGVEIQNNDTHDTPLMREIGVDRNELLTNNFYLFTNCIDLYRDRLSKPLKELCCSFQPKTKKCPNFSSRD